VRERWIEWADESKRRRRNIRKEEGEDESNDEKR
jgi:hypothetical protein